MQEHRNRKLQLICCQSLDTRAANPTQDESRDVLFDIKGAIYALLYLNRDVQSRDTLYIQKTLSGLQINFLLWPCKIPSSRRIQYYQSGCTLA